MFKNRKDAGRQLGAALKPLADRKPLVLGMARGGVIVAAEVARLLHAPLDVLVARKVGASFNPEFAIGAIAPGVVHLDPHLAESVGANRDYVAAQVSHERAIMEARQRRYRGHRPPPSLANRMVILVDDGLATGMTAIAAIQSVRRDGPARVVFAVPVGARDSVRRIARYADDVVCLEEPFDFRAVSLHYEEFEETSDADVEVCLAGSRHPARVA
jgi:predicted phosphoribosyltransferase